MVADTHLFLVFAGQALLACGDFDLSVPKVRERDGSTARGLMLHWKAHSYIRKSEGSASGGS